MNFTVPFSTQVALAVIPRWQAEGMTEENLRFLRDTVFPVDPEHPALRDALLTATEQCEGHQAATELARNWGFKPGEQSPWTPTMKRLLEPMAHAREAQNLESTQDRLERHLQQILPPLECALEGLYHLGAGDEALSYMQALRPTHADYLWAGLTALDAGALEQAEGWLHIAAQGRSPRALLALGEFYRKTENLPALQPLLSLLDGLPPSGMDTLEASLILDLRAHTLSRLGVLGEALLEAERSWAMLVTSQASPLYATRMLATLAGIQLRRGHPQAAILTLEQAMSYPTDSNFRGFKRQILQCMTGLNRPIAAARVLEELTLLVGPTQAEAEHSLDQAYLLLAQGSWAQAQQALEQALSQTPPLSRSESIEAQLKLIGLLTIHNPLSALERAEALEPQLKTQEEQTRLAWRRDAALLELGQRTPQQVSESLSHYTEDFSKRQLYGEQATALLWAAHAALKFSARRAFELLSQLRFRILEGDIQAGTLLEQWSLLPELRDFAFQKGQLEHRAGNILELSSLSPSGLSVDGTRVTLDFEALELVSFLRAHGPTSQAELGAALFPGQDALTLGHTLQRLAEHMQQNSPALSLSGSAKTPWSLQVHGTLHWDVEDVLNRLVARQGRSLESPSQNPWAAALERELSPYP